MLIRQFADEFAVLSVLHVGQAAIDSLCDAIVALC